MTETWMVQLEVIINLLHHLTSIVDDAKVPLESRQAFKAISNLVISMSLVEIAGRSVLELPQTL